MLNENKYFVFVALCVWNLKIWVLGQKKKKKRLMINRRNIGDYKVINLKCLFRFWGPFYFIFLFSLLQAVCSCVQLCAAVQLDMWLKQERFLTRTVSAAAMKICKSEHTVLAEFPASDMYIFSSFWDSLWLPLQNFDMVMTNSRKVKYMLVIQ